MTFADSAHTFAGTDEVCQNECYWTSQWGSNPSKHLSGPRNDCTNPGDVPVRLDWHWWNQRAPRIYHGYHIKQTYPACRTPYSQVARSTFVGFPGAVGTNHGPHTYYEVDFAMGLKIGHQPVDLFDPLQRAFEGECEI